MFQTSSILFNFIYVGEILLSSIRKGPYLSLEKEKEIFFRYSVKRARDFRKVVKRRQRNVQKRLITCQVVVFVI